MGQTYQETRNQRVSARRNKRKFVFEARRPWHHKANNEDATIRMPRYNVM